MSTFGDDTLEQIILDSIDRDVYTKEEIIKALVHVLGYINNGIYNESTIARC